MCDIILQVAPLISCTHRDMVVWQRVYLIWCATFTLLPRSAVSGSQEELDGIETEEDSPCSSVDPDNIDPYHYGVTPPHPRAIKRGKARASSHKYKQTKAHYQAQKAEKARSMHRGGIPRDSIDDDLVSCSIDQNEIGPEESFESMNSSRVQNKRKDASKTFKTSRAYERDYKLSSSDLVALENSVGTATPQEPIKVDSPEQFRCIKSQSLVVHNEMPSSTSLQRRQSTQSSVECSKDRVEFHRTFSMLINLGNTARQEKEKKIRQGYSRQLSSEQEMFQTQVNDLLWLELKAWFQRRTLRDQDTYLCKAREKVPELLKEISQFCVRLKPLEDSCKTEEAVSNSPVDCASCEHGGAGEPSTECTKSFSDSDINAQPMTQRCLRREVEQQKEALAQVSKVLLNLEKVERLYPTTKAVARDYSQYSSQSFQCRVETLCMWMNITRDIGHKLKLMSQVLGLDHMHMHHAVDWAWLDYDEYTHSPTSTTTSPPALSTPSICITPSDADEVGRDANGESEDSSTTPPQNRNVRFDISVSPDEVSPSSTFAPTDSSTPGKASASKPGLVSNISVSSSMSWTSSILSVDETSQTGIYRHFVDRTLKKSGLRKLLIRLKNILDGTLQRARQALERPRSSGMSCGSEQVGPHHFETVPRLFEWWICVCVHVCMCVCLA